MVFGMIKWRRVLMNASGAAIQAAPALARERHDSCFYFRLVMHHGCRKLDRE
jgi:hypothetical protein